MSRFSFDKIIIHDLEIKCFVGVYDSEHLSKRKILADITLYGDFSNACKSDDIENAVDYALVKKSVVSGIENSSFNLLETLCLTVINICLEFDGVQQVKVKVDKPAPIDDVRSVAVEMIRSKKAQDYE